jgi:hypothetical protein
MSAVGAGRLAGGPAAPRHYHLGATEENYGTYCSLAEAEEAVARQAERWLARYGEEAVRVEQGYAAVWRGGVRIDFRTAFACTNPYCAPAGATAVHHPTFRHVA